MFSEILLSTPREFFRVVEIKNALLPLSFRTPSLSFQLPQKARQWFTSAALPASGLITWPSQTDDTRPPATAQERQDREYLPVDGLRETSGLSTSY